MIETVLTAVRGDDNFFDGDATVDLDPADAIKFRAARREGDLGADGTALIVKSRGSGIVDVVTAEGKFQIQLEPADTVALTDDEALVYECILTKADVSMDTTVVKGILRLTGR